MNKYGTTNRNDVVKAGWTARSRVDEAGKTVGWFWEHVTGRTVVSTEPNFLLSCSDVKRSTYWGG